jgi:hypothetical protein
MTDTHEIHFIRKYEILGDHSLKLTFEDGFVRDVDLTPILYGKLFAPLRDPAYFKQVRLEPDFQTIEWPNGADFDPETLYNWDRYRDDMIEMAEDWKHAEAGPDRVNLETDDAIDELDCVALTKDIPALGLVIGDVGTVVHVYASGKAFEVKFITAEGHTLGVETLDCNEVMPVTGNSIMHVRELEMA